MPQEKILLESPKERWTRKEYQEKKKSIIRDLAEVINKHGFDSYFNLPDFLLADMAVSAIFQFSKFKHDFENWEFGQVLKKHAEWDGKSPHPYGCDEEDDKG